MRILVSNFQVCPIFFLQNCIPTHCPFFQQSTPTKHGCHLQHCRHPSRHQFLGLRQLETATSGWFQLRPTLSVALGPVSREPVAQCRRSVKSPQQLRSLYARRLAGFFDPVPARRAAGGRQFDDKYADPPASVPARCSFYPPPDPAAHNPSVSQPPQTSLEHL